MIATLLKKNQLTETDQKFPVLTGKDLGCWGLSRPIKIRFSEKERQVVETYLSAALQRFEDGGE